MTTVPDIARSTAEQHRMLSPGAPVLAMVSGGGDSVALLRLLAAHVFGERPLRVLHVNHGLRGADSDADEAFVRELCADLGVDVRVAAFDVGAFAEQEGLNLEDAGRRVRYRFADEELDAMCYQLDLPCEIGRIAVAHTRDDRVETFFMRALTGTGAGGLASIAPVRGRVIRPLLDCDRAQVRAWLEDSGGIWREDASNADTDRARAYVRAEIVPAAERFNPAFRTALARTMDLLRDDDALLSEMAGSFARDFAEHSDDEIVFNRAWMSTLDKTMSRRTVRAALAHTFPEASRLESVHIEALVAGIGDDHFARDLPEGLRAFSEYDRMVISRSDVESPSVAPGLLPVPGKVVLGAAGGIGARPVPADETVGTPSSIVIDADAVTHELVVDACRPGDRMRPLGMEGSRKLSDLLIDAKVPRRQRSATPVVRDGERVVWLAGVRMSDEYKVTEATMRAIRLTWDRQSAAE